MAALALALAGVGSLVLWGRVDEDRAALESADVSLASRLAVGAAGTGIVRDHPLFGTGLGSWVHAFRPYQEPPVPGGIWDHAHDDYLELAAESGLVGVGLVLLFGFTSARAARREPSAGRRRRGDGDGATAMTVTPADGTALAAERATLPGRQDAGGLAAPPGFEASEWWAALGERALLRVGLAGGVVAILVHSVVDFSLHLPANLLLAMTVMALLVVSGRRQPAAASGGVAVLAAVLALALVPQLANTARRFTGAAPLAPRDCLDAADVRFAEDGDAGRDTALALVHRALDRNPFDREAHEELASVLERGPDAEDALRRALVLEPWSAGVRDRLALALWARGERDSAVAELEDSMRRLPELTAHAYLSPETTFVSTEPTELLRSLTDGDTVELRLARLAPEMTSAVEHGLVRALDDAPAGPARDAVVDDLATLREVGKRWADAAALLHDEAKRAAASGPYLARAARDYLRAHADGPAEQTLLAALVLSPEQGDLYRKLAVEVYAARGDFERADTVLTAAEQNAVDLLPVYRGVSEVLARRDAAHVDELPPPPPAPRALDAPLGADDVAGESAANARDDDLLTPGRVD